MGDRRILTSAEEPGEKPKQRDSRGIIQQAFAFDQRRQPSWRAEVTKDADHRHRIGGCDNGAQQQAHH